VASRDRTPLRPDKPVREMEYEDDEDDSRYCEPNAETGSVV
jgi:hypothetical protein